MKRFIQDKLKVLFLTSSNAGGITLIIIFLSGVGLYTKYFYSPPQKTIEIIKDIPEFSTPDERWEWIKSNASNFSFPFDKLTDRELTNLIRQDTYGCIYKKNSALGCMPLVSSEGYLNYSYRLAKEPNPMDGDIFVQETDSEFCAYGRWGLQNLSCKTPQEQREAFYKEAIGYASLQGNFLAEKTLVDMVYNNPSCCNYSWPSSVAWYIRDWEKLEAEGNKIAMLLSAIHNLPNGLTKENLEQLKIVALAEGLGNGEAAYELFKTYKDGNMIVTKSYSYAYAWLLISHKSGYKHAIETLKDFEAILDRDFVIEGQKIAQKLSTKLD